MRTFGLLDPLIEVGQHTLKRNETKCGSLKIETDRTLSSRIYLKHYAISTTSNI